MNRVRFALMSFTVVCLIALSSAKVCWASASETAGATAGEVMDHAMSEAAASHRNILVMFGASWCGNCRLFDRFLKDARMHPLMERSFVFVDLNTGEHANDSKHANIPGGQKLQLALGGGEAGYPYLAMTDDHGKMLANSLRPAGRGKFENTGYPDSQNEIGWFVEMLKKGAPGLSSEDLAQVQRWLTDHSTQKH